MYFSRILLAFLLCLFSCTISSCGLAESPDMRMERLDTEAKAYVLRTIPIVASHWDERELRANASKEFIAVLDARKTDWIRNKKLDKTQEYSKFKPLFDGMSEKLGAFKSVQDIEIQEHNVVDNPDYGEIYVGKLVSAVNFNKGSATITTEVRKQHNGWLFDLFVVKSDDKSPRAVSSKTATTGSVP
jgi:hypothetical protein